METTPKHHDPLPFAHLAGEFHSSFDGFRAGVHEEHLLDAGRSDLHDALCRGEDRVVEEGAAGVPQAGELSLGCGQDLGVDMAQIQDGNPAGEIEVTVAIGVGDPGPGAFHDLNFGVIRNDWGDDVVIASRNVGHPWSLLSRRANERGEQSLRLRNGVEVSPSVAGRRRHGHIVTQGRT